MTHEFAANPRKRTKLPHSRPSWLRGDAAYFITVSCTPRGRNHLCDDAVAAIIWESVKFRQERGEWLVQLILLMPDHLHLLASLPGHGNLPKLIANWKEIIAKQTQVRWQRDFFDHRLRSDESHQEKADYIRLNPVRKGLVGRPEEWRFVWTPQTAGPAVPPYPV